MSLHIPNNPAFIAHVLVPDRVLPGTELDVTGNDVNLPCSGVEPKNSGGLGGDAIAEVEALAVLLEEESTAIFLQPFGDEFSCDWPDARQSGQYLETDAETLDTRNAKLFFSKVLKIVQKERPALHSGMNIRARILRTSPGKGRLCAALVLDQPSESPDALFVGEIIKALSREVAAPTSAELHEKMLNMATRAQSCSGVPTGSIAGSFVEACAVPTPPEMANHLHGLDKSALMLVFKEAPALSTALARSTEGRQIQVLQGESELAHEQVHVKEKSSEVTTEPLKPAIYKFCGMDRERKSITLMTYEGKRKSFTVSYTPERSGEELEQLFVRMRRVGLAFERDDSMADEQGAPLLEASLVQLSKGGRVSSHSIDSFKPVFKNDGRLLKS